MTAQIFVRSPARSSRVDSKADPVQALKLVSRLLNSYTVVASATAPGSRSDEGAMLFHCDRGATTKTGPFRPTRRADGGCGRSRRRDSSALKERLPPHRSSTSPRKSHRQRYGYLG